MKKGTIFLFVSLALLCALLLQSHYDYACKANGAGWASVTIHGVLCGYTLNGMEKHIRLSDLLARDGKDRIYRECVERNNGAEYRKPTPVGG